MLKTLLQNTSEDKLNELLLIVRREKTDYKHVYDCIHENMSDNEQAINILFLTEKVVKFINEQLVSGSTIKYLKNIDNNSETSPIQCLVYFLQPIDVQNEQNSSFAWVASTTRQLGKMNKKLVKAYVRDMKKLKMPIPTEKDL